jgi:hypothetical protein
LPKDLARNEECKKNNSYQRSQKFVLTSSICVFEKHPGVYPGNAQ